MKIALSFLLIIFVYNSAFTQQIKPYLAVVKTTQGQQKGILQRVDSNYVVLDAESGFVRIETKLIKSIKIKVVKSPYQAKTYINYSWDTSEYNISQGDKMVNKWGEVEPTLGEQITGSVATGVINGVANLMAIPIQAINSPIASYSFKNKLTAEEEQSLSYFSIDYQRSPQSMLALKNLKAIK
ncbi:hypothetical protein FA048_11940 [Pedobacter polaris]|uniref:Uncharacterized protein n=1 Tax=Pedobacter polaris TaxID=2571273 RepID=A0A4V5P342_9SPHI|nr:hypothetical protein [Pedobacter polaris]TKC10872.1 hypothetical protein FA048_11940 [Pedobacter polaris]